MARPTALGDLSKVSDRWSVVVHVLRKWTVFKKGNPAEGFCSSMILIDREVSHDDFSSGVMVIGILYFPLVLIFVSFIFFAGNKDSGKYSWKGVV